MAFSFKTGDVQKSLNMLDAVPVDGREVFDSLGDAQAAADSAAAYPGESTDRATNYYVGQQLCVYTDGTPKWYMIDKIGSLKELTANNTELEAEIENIQQALGSYITDIDNLIGTGIL